MDERPSRLELTFAPRIAIAVLGASLLAALIAGAPQPQLRPLAVFLAAFPLLWIGLASLLSYESARALRVIAIDSPARAHALGDFRLTVTFGNDGLVLPAVGVLTNVRFSSGGLAIENGPWADIPILEAGRAAMSRWDVMVKRRGLLRVGPFRAAVEFPGSALRATAIFDTGRTVIVLPAVYHLQPFIDALLAGRHAAGARSQMLPVAIEEYVGSREYRPGDSPKLIHRILSLRARSANEFFVREFRDPSRDDISVILDTAPPTDGDERTQQYRFEKAIAFVSALCRTLAARRLTVRFVCQRAPHDVTALLVRPLDADLDRLDRELALLELAGDRRTLSRLLLGEVRRHGAAVIFVSLRQRESAEQQRLPIATLTPDHVPVFTREVVGSDVARREAAEQETLDPQAVGL